MTKAERANELARGLGFKNAYDRRIQSALSRGASVSQARGHARKKKGELSARELKSLQKQRGLQVKGPTDFFKKDRAAGGERVARPTLKQINKLTGFERKFSELVRFFTDRDRKLWAAFDFGRVSNADKMEVKQLWKEGSAEGFLLRRGGPVERALEVMNVIGTPATDYGKLIAYTLQAEALEGE